ncbi:MAG: helix-turn-helix transcriptional regulator [Dehalococcoidia bacterium]|nr:helix-turn-helix transcriptional regulator [Dehalococcoidia bacterium]
MPQKKILAFGPVLRNLRLERNWTQAELGEKLGVTPQHVSMLESGKKFPSLQMLFLVADALGVSLTSIAAAMEERLK